MVNPSLTQLTQGFEFKVEFPSFYQQSILNSHNRENFKSELLMIQWLQYIIIIIYSFRNESDSLQILLRSWAATKARTDSEQSLAFLHSQIQQLYFRTILWPESKLPSPLTSYTFYDQQIK